MKLGAVLSMVTLAESGLDVFVLEQTTIYNKKAQISNRTIESTKRSKPVEHQHSMSNIP